MTLDNLSLLYLGPDDELPIIYRTSSLGSYVTKIHDWWYVLYMYPNSGFREWRGVNGHDQVTCENFFAAGSWQIIPQQQLSKAAISALRALVREKQL